ncbi:hypothetical protein [Dactylosporangium sp. NPDC051541]|uniref:hypothetical protein n=1 Tax=Dactylosporangium sp. NPDC051541 TaxID=3363977 RepID=UPI0037AC588A
MTSMFNAIAVLALLGVVLLLFANSALLKMVRDLQRALVEAQAGGHGAFGATPAMTVPRFAAGDGRSTYVLVVDASCPACRDRAEDYAQLSRAAPAGELVALVKDQACAVWFAASAVRVEFDAALLGTVGVGVTPMLIRYDPDGTEAWRRVVGSREDLDRFLEISESGAAERA